jgi:hypothetical protein
MIVQFHAPAALPPRKQPPVPLGPTSPSFNPQLVAFPTALSRLLTYMTYFEIVLCFEPRTDPRVISAGRNSCVVYVTSQNVWYPAYRLSRRDITIDCPESAALPANSHRVRESVQPIEPELSLYKLT